jgi:hypothetical protein
MARTMTERSYYVKCIIPFFVLTGDIAIGVASRILGTMRQKEKMTKV